jgi:hypothetical protein
VKGGHPGVVTLEEGGEGEGELGLPVRDETNGSVSLCASQSRKRKVSRKGVLTIHPSP